MTKEQREQYVRQICKDKNYNAEATEKAVVAAHAAAEGESGSILDDILSLPLNNSAQFNRKIDEVKAYEASLKTWKAGADQALAMSKQEAEQLKARIAKFEETHGSIDEIDDQGDGTGKDKAGNVVDMTKVNELVQNRDQHHLALLVDSDEVIQQHFNMFGKLIGRKQLLMEVGKAASEGRNITIREAYDTLYGEEVKQKTAAEQKANEDKLRAEGAEAERKRLQKAGVRLTGAAISENASGGIAFAAINSEGNKDDAARKLTEDDRLSLFGQELRTELDKREAAMSDA